MHTEFNISNNEVSPLHDKKSTKEFITNSTYNRNCTTNPLFINHRYKISSEEQR